MRLYLKSLSLAIVFIISSASASLAETRLLMFETKGCYWCEKWREEVGVIYDKTPEGKIAILQVEPLTKAAQKQYDLQSGIFYSPTFVLVDDKKEIGRIEGYPGPDFFWGMLEKLIEKLEQVDPVS